MPGPRLARPLVLLAWCLAGWAWSGTAGVPDTAPAPSPAAVQEALGKLLGELRSRRLAPAGDDELGRLACQALLDAFAPGGVVVGREAGEPAGVPQPGPLLARIRTIDNRFGYIRIAVVEPGLREAIATARGQLPNSAEGGTIVDLRDGGGNAAAAAAESAVALGSWGLPVVVIVNGQTRAAAELLADNLRREQGAVLLGEPTRGVPYPFRPVQIAGDMAVLLPEVPDGMIPAPLRPDVPVVPRIDGPTNGRHRPAASAEEERDECVRQAVDLLTAICTFRQKHF